MFRNWLLEIWLISLAELEIGCWHEADPISLICRAAGAKKFLEIVLFRGVVLSLYSQSTVMVQRNFHPLYSVNSVRLGPGVVSLREQCVCVFIYSHASRQHVKSLMLRPQLSGAGSSRSHHSLAP